MAEKIKKIFINLELNSKIAFWLIWAMIIVLTFGFLTKNYDIAQVSGIIIYFLFIILVFWRLAELQKSPESFSERSTNILPSSKDYRVEIDLTSKQINRKLLTGINISAIILYFLIFGVNINFISLILLFGVLVIINLVLALGSFKDFSTNKKELKIKTIKKNKLSKKNRQKIIILNICILGIYFLNYGFNFNSLRLMVLAVILLVVNAFSLADSLNEKYG